MENLKKKIEKAYIRHLLVHGKSPSSVFIFMEGLGEEEGVFYDHYASFRSLDNSLWGEFMEETLNKVKNEEVYAEYSAREKLLSFYFTLIEVLKQKRSYVVYTFEASVSKRSFPPMPFLKHFKEKFEGYANELIMDGTTSGELQDRPIIGKKYADILWGQLIMVLKFWVKDDSAGFEKTDTAIEKAVHLSFDLMGNNVFDSAFDFAKFLFQRD